MTRNEMIAKAREYVVINDGQCIYPVHTTDLRTGDSEQTIREMGPEEYGQFCQEVPAEQRVAIAGSGEMSDLCDALIEAGATYWKVA